MTDAEEFVFKWNGREFKVPIADGETVNSLKHKIQAQTNVQPKRQKLLGLKDRAGKIPTDEHLLGDLQLKPGQKIMLMGPPEAAIEASDQQALIAPHIQDDFLDVNEDELQETAIKNLEAFQDIIKKRLQKVEIPVLNPPRSGKKCLVLDIDYTFFDLGSAAERPDELLRPYLHEMLKAVYPVYDIVIWSANSLQWMEVKLRQLHVSNNQDYKITCLLDCRCMIPVRTEKRGFFECKPLAFLWEKLPQFYNPENTVMIDDLRRNFIHNKQNGLVIKAFKHAHRTRATDKELLHLKIYLLKIADLRSFRSLKHSKWAEYVKKELQELQQPASDS